MPIIDIEIALRRPRRLVAPFSWAEHVPFALWLVHAHRPRTFVELGTHIGNSYFAFCQAMADLSGEVSASAVDTWLGDEHAGHYGDDVFRNVSEYNLQHYSKFSTLIRRRFDQALELFTDGTVDLLHIDGLHTEDAVRQDFNSWLPKLSDRAVVLFHDTEVRDHGFGVHRVWGELRLSYPSFSFLHGYGLGVLGVGEKAAPVLAALTSDPVFTTSVFEAIGRGARTEAELAILTAKNESLVAELNEQKSRTSRAQDRAVHFSRVFAESESRHIELSRSPRWLAKRLARSTARRLKELLLKSPPSDAPARAGASFFEIESRKQASASSIISAALPRTVAPVNSDGRPKVDVIIPVYSGYEETVRCIESVVATIPRNLSMDRIVIIDDCGPDESLRNYVRSIRNAHVTVLTNDRNMGFVASVNRGMTTSSNDVILLNSDTLVAGNWVDRLRGAAHSQDRIGTVTPFSNNATICSYPFIGEGRSALGELSVEDIDSVAARMNGGLVVDLPTAVGFCMYIKRECLSELGLFDVDAFGEGYGEESDFCCRAIEGGWTNVLSAETFVFHKGSVSFGATAEKRRERAGGIIRQRYRDYDRSIAQWCLDDPAWLARLRITMGLLAYSDRGLVLNITHTWGGGTEKHIAALSVASKNAEAVLMVRSSAEGYHCNLLLPHAFAPWQALDFIAFEIADLSEVVQALKPSFLRLHHTAEFGNDLQSFLASANVPYSVVVHDYSLICPRTNLAKSGLYCGEPDEQGCLKCLSEHPHGASLDIVWWRHLGRTLLENADTVECPSSDVERRIKRYAPNALTSVIPHELDLYRPTERALAPTVFDVSGDFRIASLGVFAQHKGAEFLLDCVERSKDRKLPIRWHTIGTFDASFASRANSLSSVLTVTGAYISTDMPSLISAADPHLVFFPQHIPETYSYTLSEAFKAGRATLTPSLGAFSERVRGLRGCWEYGIDDTPDTVLDMIMEIRRSYVQAKAER